MQVIQFNLGLDLGYGVASLPKELCVWLLQGFNLGMHFWNSSQRRSQELVSFSVKLNQKVCSKSVPNVLHPLMGFQITGLCLNRCA